MERTLIVGLGNPGKKYARTRHNVGTDAIEVLAKRLGVSLKLGRDRAQIAETRINGQAVVLAIPTTYMNDSGEAVGPLARRYKIEDQQTSLLFTTNLILSQAFFGSKLVVD